MSKLIERIEEVDFLLTPAQYAYLQSGKWLGANGEEKTFAVCFAAITTALEIPMMASVVLMTHGTKEERRIVLERIAKAIDERAHYEPLTETLYLSNGSRIMLSPFESKATLTEAVQQDHSLAGSGIMFFED